MIIIFGDCAIYRSRSKTLCSWAGQRGSWSVMKWDHNSSNLTMSCHHLATWMRGSHRMARDILTLVHLWYSDKMYGTHRRCFMINLRTCVNRLWIVDLEISVSLFMFLIEENGCSAKTTVMVSLILSHVSICSSTGWRSSGPELCFAEIQYKHGICHSIETKRVYNILMYCVGWYRLQPHISYNWSLTYVRSDVLTCNLCQSSDKI
jgi:hypothetical protein